MSYKRPYVGLALVCLLWFEESDTDVIWCEENMGGSLLIFYHQSSLLIRPSMHNKQLDYEFYAENNSIIFWRILHFHLQPEHCYNLVSQNNHKIRSELYAKSAIRNLCNGFIRDNILLSSSRSLMISVWGKKHWVNFALRILRMSDKKTNDQVVCISTDIIGRCWQ